MVVEVAASCSPRCRRMSWRSGCDSAFHRRASPVTRRGVMLTGAAYHHAGKFMQRNLCREIYAGNSLQNFLCNSTVVAMQTCELLPAAELLPACEPPLAAELPPACEP